MSKKNLGSIDDFLKKENIFEEARAQANKEVVAWPLAKADPKREVVASYLGTSRILRLPIALRARCTILRPRSKHFPIVGGRAELLALANSC